MYFFSFSQAKIQVKAMGLALPSDVAFWGFPLKDSKVFLKQFIVNNIPKNVVFLLK
jgi:hypothetical protein